MEELTPRRALLADAAGAAAGRADAGCTARPGRGQSGAGSAGDRRRQQSRRPPDDPARRDESEADR